MWKFKSNFALRALASNNMSIPIVETHQLTFNLIGLRPINRNLKSKDIANIKYLPYRLLVDYFVRFDIFDLFLSTNLSNFADELSISCEEIL